MREDSLRNVPTLRLLRGYTDPMHVGIAYILMIVENRTQPLELPRSCSKVDVMKSPLPEARCM